MMTLLARLTGRAQIRAKATKPGLDVFNGGSGGGLPPIERLTVQLQAKDPAGARCWKTTFDSPQLSTSVRFKARKG